MKLRCGSVPARASAYRTLISAPRISNSRRFNEAEPKLLLAIQQDPSFPLPYRILAACYAHMGRRDDARATVERLRAITRVVIPDRVSYLRNAEHRELLLSGLRLAMGEAV